MKELLLAIMVLLIIYYYFYSPENMQPDPNSTEKKINSTADYVKSMREGILKGVISSVITGGGVYEKMIDGAVSYGILNPILKYIE